MLAAGVVLFGKTKVPLLLGDCETVNAIDGTTNNPGDLSRVPGMLTSARPSCPRKQRGGRPALAGPRARASAQISILPRAR